jgi:hypothetical protein
MAQVGMPAEIDDDVCVVSNMTGTMEPPPGEGWRLVAENPAGGVWVRDAPKVRRNQRQQFEAHFLPVLAATAGDAAKTGVWDRLRRQMQAPDGVPTACWGRFIVVWADGGSPNIECHLLEFNREPTDAERAQAVYQNITKMPTRRIQCVYDVDQGEVVYISFEALAAVA